MVAVDAFILGVDLDGVCAEHTLAFRTIVAERMGVDEATLPLERSWGFSEWGFGPGDFEDHHKHAVIERRMFRDLEPMPGAADALWRLSDAGIWIRIITHRLYVNWGHKTAVADTVHWLDQHQIPYRDLCFLGAKPQVEANLYIDDSPDNVTELRAAGNDVIIYDQPYNRDLSGSRAASWDQAEQLIMESYTRWTGMYGVQPTLPGVAPARRIRDSSPPSIE
jgi:5'-nucleotidase